MSLCLAFRVVRPGIAVGECLSNARGRLFYRLLQNAVVMRKLDYETIVWSRRGQAGKLRGRKRMPKKTAAPTAARSIGRDGEVVP
jgi:hypothetical protein